MEEIISDIVVGTMMGLFGLLGLIMAMRAHDQEILVFGIGLAAFGILFVFGRIGAFYDRRKAAFAPAVTKARHHG